MLTNKRKLEFFTFMIILILILADNTIVLMRAFNNFESHPANSMWIEPSKLKINDRNDKFNITIWINLTQNSFAWQIKLNFNSSFFNATRTGYTDGNRSKFFSEYSTIPITPKINNEKGFILLGETLLGSDEKPSGYGSLMWAEFNRINDSIKNGMIINFSLPYGIDTFVLDPYFDIVPLDSIKGADISFSFEPPFLLYIGFLISIIIIFTIIVFIIYKIRRKKKRLENHE